MSFKTNDVEQLSLFDSFTNLTSREQKALENSWAKVFAEEVLWSSFFVTLLAKKISLFIQLFSLHEVLHSYCLFVHGGFDVEHLTGGVSPSYIV